MDELQGGGKIIFWSITIVVLLVVGWFVAPFKIINAGERGVVLRLGHVSRVMSDGLNWKTPFIDSVHVLDIRTQKEQVEVTAASKDLQSVNAVIALNYHLEGEKVGDLWKNVGEDYKVRIIDPAVQESVKAATAQYTAEELITKRPLVKDDIKTSLSDRLSREFVAVDEVSIVDFDFSGSFNAAIEAKVTAEQNALAAKNKLEQIKYEAEQTVTSAKAQAEAIQIQAEAIQQQGGANYVQLQAVQKWDGKLPTQMIPGGTVPFLNLKN